MCKPGRADLLVDIDCVLEHTAEAVSCNDTLKTDSSNKEHLSIKCIHPWFRWYLALAEIQYFCTEPIGEFLRCPTNTPEWMLRVRGRRS